LVKKKKNDQHSNKDNFSTSDSPQKEIKEDLLSHRKRPSRPSSMTAGHTLKEGVLQKPRVLERTVACLIGLAVFFGCIRFALGDSPEVARNATVPADTLALVY